MTLEQTSLELISSLVALRQTMDEMLILITEARPHEHSLAHRFEYSATNVLGRLNAALESGITFQQRANCYDYGNACDALGICHAEFNQAAENFHGELRSLDWQQDLDSLVTEHPKDWMGWAISIKATLDACNLTAIHIALLKCWQSLFASSGAISTLQVKSINRHLMSRGDQAQSMDLR